MFFYCVNYVIFLNFLFFSHLCHHVWLFLYKWSASWLLLLAISCWILFACHPNIFDWPLGTALGTSCEFFKHWALTCSGIPRFPQFQFNVIYYSILFSSPLALISNLNLRGFFMCPHAHINSVNRGMPVFISNQSRPFH